MRTACTLKLTISALLISTALLAGCSTIIPTESPTRTPQPATELPPPPPDNSPPATPTNDDNIFAAAMRPGFEDDLLPFIDTTRYFLDIYITPAPHIVSGHQQVDFANNSGDTLDQIVFRLYPNILSGRESLLVENVMVDGTPAEVLPDDDITVLTIPLANPLAPDERANIELDFSLEIPFDRITDGYGRLGHHDDLLSLPSFFPILSVYDPQTGQWWRETPSPHGDPVYSESALFEVILTAPADAVIATVGQTISTSDNGDGTIDYHIVSGPVRDFAIYMSNNFEVVQSEEDGITVNVYSLPGGNLDDEYALATTHDTLRLFNRDFGQYPFAELDVVETPTLAGGIEYPGLYVAASQFWHRDEPFFETVIVHETAHQWWCSLVGNNQVSQPWLDESLTEYSVKLYLDEYGGTTSGDSLINSREDRVQAFTAGDNREDLPIGLPVAAYSQQEYVLFVYLKGSIFFDLLSDLYGEQAMLEFIQTYFEQYKYGLATREDLQTLAEDVFDDDEITLLFDEWVGPAE